MMKLNVKLFPDQTFQNETFLNVNINIHSSVHCNLASAFTMATVPPKVNNDVDTFLSYLFRMQHFMVFVPLLKTSIFWYMTPLLPDSLSNFAIFFSVILLSNSLFLVLYTLVFLRVQTLILFSYYILFWGMSRFPPRVPPQASKLYLQSRLLSGTSDSYIQMPRNISTWIQPVQNVKS